MVGSPPGKIRCERRNTDKRVQKKMICMDSSLNSVHVLLHHYDIFLEAEYDIFVHQ
jgi:hypothetical protein